MTRLTIRQKLFVDGFDGNATKSAKRAGYHGSNAVLAVSGSRLLKLPKIKKAIAERDAERNTPLIADRQELQQKWTEILRHDSAPMQDRLKASELLARSQALFTKNIRVSGTLGHLTEAELFDSLRRCLDALPKDLLRGLLREVGLDVVEKPTLLDHNPQN